MKPKPNGQYVGQQRAREEVTSEILSTAMCTIAQLAQLFETDAKTLPQRLKALPPASTRRGNKVFRIKDAASFLVTPGYEIEEYIRQMSPQELPPLLSKEFWNGQKSRLEFEIKQGQHWPTEEVVGFAAELMNTIRMNLLLVVDDVNREQTLTDGQRKVFQRITDAAIVTMGQEIAKRFESYHADRAADREQDDAIDHDEILAAAASEDDEPILAAEDDDDPILAAAADEEEDDRI